MGHDRLEELDELDELDELELDAQGPLLFLQDVVVNGSTQEEELEEELEEQLDELEEDEDEEVGRQLDLIIPLQISEPEEQEQEPEHNDLHDLDDLDDLDNWDVWDDLPELEELDPVELEELEELWLTLVELSPQKIFLIIFLKTLIKYLTMMPPTTITIMIEKMLVS